MIRSAQIKWGDHIAWEHWCPACEATHIITDSWTFDGDVDKPTFSPSVKVTYNGPDAGQKREDAERAPYACCHYFIKAGIIDYCGDSTHPLAGKKVPLPPIRRK